MSHLDLARCMQRAIKRSRIPIWYTRGFNPRAYMMFPLPLTLGVTSDCEILDIAIVEPISNEELIERLNAVLPKDLQIISASEPIKKHVEIAFAEYLVKVVTDEKKDIEFEFTEFLNRETIQVEKFSKKKGTVSVDIKDSIKLIGITNNDDGSAEITLQLVTGTQKNINANLVFEAFEKYRELKISEIGIKRTKIICENGELFA